MRILEPCIGELIRIGDGISIAVLEVSGSRVTLALHAPQGVRIREFAVPADTADPYFDFEMPTDVQP